MDRDEPFSFEAGSSGPEGDIGASGSKSSVTDANPSGRIDPAIARATGQAGKAPEGPNGGTGSDNGGGNSDTAVSPGKRGRHKSDCACERCIAKRNGNPETQAQTSVGSSDKERNIRASFVTRTLQILHLIASKAANAPELELEDDDAKLLGDATAEVLKHYKVKMTPKQEAYAVLIEAAAQVYPAMAVSLYMRKMAEREKNPPKWSPKQPAPASTAYKASEDLRAPGIQQAFTVSPPPDGKWQ